MKSGLNFETSIPSFRIAIMNLIIIKLLSVMFLYLYVLYFTFHYNKYHINCGLFELTEKRAWSPKELFPPGYSQKPQTFICSRFPCRFLYLFKNCRMTLFVIINHLSLLISSRQSCCPCADFWFCTNQLISVQKFFAGSAHICTKNYLQTVDFALICSYFLDFALTCFFLLILH